MIEIGDVVGSYRITGLLGVGGMGSVLRGVHVADGSEAAIKTVSAPRESLLPAIRREIVALGKLRHPGIVRILESGSVDGVPWYAMELHDPRSLVDLRDALWSTDAAPDLRPAWTAVRCLCEALAYLHGEGMVHGDIKPSNVLWGPEGRTVLIDFGLLTAFGEQGRDAIDPRAHAAGSLVYMAPEQIDGEPIDARADLYAVGCVLYELVTGRPPFEHTRVDDLLDAHRHATPTPPSARGLPRALDDLILRLLAKRPRDRIGHAVDVAARLVELGAEASGVRGPRPRPYLYRPGLAGRQRRVDELSACVDACFVAGRPGLAFVVGESGVGKTRLIAEVARAAQLRGARVLSGVCAATSVGGLHGLARPLLAIADRCRAEGAEETLRLVGGRGKLLARYQPALAGLPGQGSEPEPSELPFEAARALVSHELCVTFEALAADRPLLLIVDDLQWADELTLAFLQALRERATATHARVFVIGAARSDEIGAGLGSLVADDPTRRFDLDRIDEDGVRTMVGDMLASTPSDALVRFVARETEGNPFFVAEYLRAAVVEGLITRDDRGRFRLVGDDEASLSSLSLPRSLRALVARRMAGIGDDARRVLDVSAVLGRDLEPELVIEVAGIDDAAYGRAIGALLDRQILEDAGEGLRFSHDKVREVAAESVGDEVRASIHRSAARAYEARVDASPGAAGAAAHHWFAAGDEAKAAPLLLLAARRSLVECDNERTQSGYRRALSILEGAPSDAVTRALLEWRGRWEDAEDPGVSAGTDEAAALREARRVAHRGLGDTYATIGRYDDAIAEYEAAMTVSDGEVARADALARIGGANFAKGELLIAAQHLGEALACLGERVPETRLDALRSIVRSSGLLVARLVQRRPLEAARARAVERLRVRILNRLTYINYSFSIERAAATHLAALAAAERIATTSEAAETFAHHGPLFAGHWASSARYHALRAIEVCRGEGHLAMLMTAEFMAGMCFAFQAEWEAAAEHFRAAIDLYPRVGDANVLQTAHENLAYVLLYRGDHGGALAEASRSLALAERTGDVRGTVNSACHVALANLRLGDLEQARRVADQALVALASLEDPVVHCILYTVRGRIERAAGDLEAARVALDRAVSIAEEHHLVQEEVVPAYTELVEVDTQLPGRSSEAARLLARASSIGRRFPAHRGPLLRAEALLLAREGRTRAAFRCLTRAARIHREQGMRHELGCTLTVLTALARGDL